MYNRKKVCKIIRKYLKVYLMVEIRDMLKCKNLIVKLPVGAAALDNSAQFLLFGYNFETI